MASLAFKPCAHPGCRELTRSVYCEKHRPPEAKRRGTRETQWRKLYSLPLWTDVLRPDQLLREPYCRECTARAVRAHRPELMRIPATDVDHIRPHRGDMKLFSDPGNLQSLCHSCHAKKTAREVFMRR